jgi:diguanylate cyclase (GGDEF)-like protein
MKRDYLHGITASVNKLTRAKNEFEFCQSIAESLINDFGFDGVTVRKVDWERSRLCLVSYLGFTDEIKTFEVPISEPTSARSETTLTSGAINLYEEALWLAALRPAPKFCGRNTEATAHFHDIFPIKVSGRVEVIVGVYKNTNRGGLNSQRKRVLNLFSEIAGGILENVLNQEALIRDALTGLFNRKYFLKRLSEELERAKRYDTPLSCCLFDIDDFKVINDTYGHLFGDHVLREIGRLTKNMVRATDIVARYGGEEFVILFPQTRLDDATVAVEHIRRTISTLTFERRVRVTATFGMSSILPEIPDDSNTLLHRADMALYEGKKQYRKNCIVTYSEHGSKPINEQELWCNSADMSQTHDSLPRIVNADAIIDKARLKKSLLAARAKRGSARLRAQVIKARDWKGSLREEIALAILGVILFVLIPALFAEKRGDNGGIPIFSPAYTSLNSSCTVSMYDDRSSNTELELISPFEKYIEATRAKVQRQLTVAKKKKSRSRRGTYTRSGLMTTSGRELVKADLRRAFLLADL